MTHAKQLVATVVALFLAAFLGSPALAQTTVTADWTNLGKANLEAVNNGDTLSAGTNTITINTSIVRDGDSNDGNFQPFYSTGMLSYYTGQIGSQTGPLLYNMDHSVFDAGDYFQSTYTFTNTVQQLSFTIGNVDRRFLISPYFHDAIVIEYDTGTGAWQNLRNLGAYTLESAVGTTTINGQAGFHGTGYAGSMTSTTGDIRVNFGSTTVKRVRVRYLFGQRSPSQNPNGDYQYVGMSDFRWQEIDTTSADLSLNKTVSNSSPTLGSSISYTLTLTNAASSPQTANSIVVQDQLPQGVNYVSHSGSGTYSAATGNWSIASLAPGASASLTIQVTVNASSGASVTNGAEVIASSAPDPDSTPNNNSTTEDDDAFATFTVSGARVAGTPPTFSCPNTSVLFDWDLVSWTSGSTVNSYPLGGLGNITFTLNNPDTWLNNADVGGQSPSLQNIVHGGTFERTLLQLVDMANRTNVVTTTIDLPAIMQGARFSIFDVDYENGQFADRVVVYGELDGAIVYPTLTNGVANYVIGNEAFGDGVSDSDRPDGNLIVTFSDPIDRIVVQYGNHSLAPSNPGQQGISLYDILLCRPVTTLSATKISSILSDPVNGATEPKAIPGALVEYSIFVSNTGISPADADSVLVTDDVPADAKMCLTDIGGAGPIVFTDGGTSSGLTYSYTSITDPGDDLQFSNDDGATWTYAPTLDADGCDNAITDFRIVPSGAFASSGSFTLRARFIVE